MKLFIQIFLFFLLIGCQSKENKNYESKISGKWRFEEEYLIPEYNDEGYEEPPPPPRDNLGYNFFSKDSCETNFSFFKINDTTKVDWKENYSGFKTLGRKTIYKIENDSLKIFNRKFNRWESFYIMRLNTKNLILNNQNFVIQKFARVLKD